MGNLTYEMMEKMKKVNFRFPAYEHFLNLGMIYYYEGVEYFIGGNSFADYTELDKIVAKNGCWLPTDSQLLEWLCLVGMDYSISFDSQSQCYHVIITDSINSAQYSANGRTLALVLASAIYRICKSNLRCYLPNEIERLEFEKYEM